MVHVGELPLHPPPCQPAKTMEASGVTASLIDVPEANDAEQPVLLPVRQEMPVGVLTTAPVPFPVKASVRLKLLGGGGAGGFTVIVTLAVAPLYVLVSVGVNVTESVCVPAASTVPAGGLYANVPATLAVASNCGAPRGVGFVIAAGCGQVIVGVAFAVELGFPVLAAFEAAPHEIRIAHAGTRIASDTKESKESLFHTTTPRPRMAQAGMAYTRRDSVASA